MGGRVYCDLQFEGIKSIMACQGRDGSLAGM